MTEAIERLAAGVVAVARVLHEQAVEEARGKPAASESAQAAAMTAAFVEAANGESEPVSQLVEGLVALASVSQRQLATGDADDALVARLCGAFVAAAAR